MSGNHRTANVVAKQEARLAEMEALEEARAEYEAQVYSDFVARNGAEELEKMYRKKIGADLAQEMNNLNR